MDKAAFLSTSPEYAALAIAGSFETRRKLPSRVSARLMGATWVLITGTFTTGSWKPVCDA
jgi:hypothetical protein